MPPFDIAPEYYRDLFNFQELFPTLPIPIGSENNTVLDLLQEEITRTQNPIQAAFLAYITGYRTYRMQSVILSSKDIKYALFFARYIPGANLQSLQKVLLQDKRLKYLCKFALTVPGANIKQIEKIVLRESQKKLSHPAFLLLQHSKGSHFKEFRKLILRSGSPSFLYWLALQKPTPKELRQIERLLLQTGNFAFIRRFAQNVEGANIQKLEEFVLNSGNVIEIKAFAKAVKSAKSRGLSILF